MAASVERLKSILHKPSSARNAEDIQEICNYMYSIKFFEHLHNNLPVLQECCAYMTYEHFPPEKQVFNIGDYGDKFYILLEGEVSVLVHSGKSEGNYFKEIMTLVSGSSFGDLALLENKPRSATILTKVECHFAVLDRSNYQRILANIMKKQKLELVSFLQTQSMFKSFTKGSLVKLSYCFDERILRKDQVLFVEGAKVEYLYLIKEGEIKISKDILMKKVDIEGGKYKELLNKRFKQRAEISLLSVGEFLGLYDMERGVYENTAACASHSAEVLQLSISDFNRRLNIKEIKNTISQRRIMKDAIHESSIHSIAKVIREKESSPYRRINMSITPSTATGRKLRVEESLESSLYKSSFEKTNWISRDRVKTDATSFSEYMIKVQKLERRPRSLKDRINFEESETRNTADMISRLSPFGRRKKIIARKKSLFMNIHISPKNSKSIQASRFYSKREIN